jgi:hypothetical protein
LTTLDDDVFHPTASLFVNLSGGDAKEEEDNDGIRNVDVGFVVGAGMTFDRLVIEARYTFRLTDLRGAEF